MIGGIDLGGTKIEARLFDDTAERTHDMRRVPTPLDDFDALFAGLTAQIDWLRDQAGDPALAVGVCVPGVIDPQTGAVWAANVPLAGQDLGAALTAHYGRSFPVVVDSMAFAYSETHGGAGQDGRCVLGLVLGTGVGAGLCLDGAFPPRAAGLAVEIGHVGVPARALARHGLPLWGCGCGRAGCWETCISGTGLARLASHVTGQAGPAEQVTDPATLDIWADLTGEALATLQNLIDPDVIVIGGGLSRRADLIARLPAALEMHRLGQTRAPAIRVARHGDSSGARGAALLAATRC
ncbi:adenine methyltransferase [Loktanella sp. 3ANDIMAR09]|nr:adenine methyltransferase [Loktanella sp. 3ANDIMAR09]